MEVFANTQEKNEALVKVLKQACSRNKAIERKELWAQKAREDRGSDTTISLKSRDGEVRTITRLPKGSNVTSNEVNKYEEERAKNSEFKEDTLLGRFCDGKDNAWRPAQFFTEACGDKDVPPWPVRPTEIFTNPELCMKIMAAQMERRKLRKMQKKLKRYDEEDARKAERLAKGKSEKNGKKDKKSRKAKKEKKAKGKKEKKEKKAKKDKKEKKDKREKKSKDKKRSKRQKVSEEDEDESGSSSSDEEIPAVPRSAAEVDSDAEQVSRNAVGAEVATCAAPGATPGSGSGSESADVANESSDAESADAESPSTDEADWG
mmetsp:Transcript_61695/g.133668  ORF Transcript_61695/g.133668 Transcript_61695/m.133668 type:complete len:319 (-) Transcript_61695:73-1029(-)